MASTVVVLINPAAGQNGNGIANGAACPVVQSPADPHRDHANTFRVTCTQAHSYKVYGFTDGTSTTLTDGTELSSVPGKQATTGNGYEVVVFSDRSWAGFAVVVTNASGGAAANVGVDRIVGS